MKLLSNVRLGAACGFISGIDMGILNRLAVLGQPATLRLPGGQEEAPQEEQTVLRARLVRQALGAH